jgi:hypothetical protein
VALAWVIPDLGSADGPLKTSFSTKAGVALIFLIQGLTLPSTALRKGLSQWRLHLLVQSFTFLVFPVMGIVLDRLAGGWLAPDLRLGFLYLAVLPSTITTSVILTGMAGGNIEPARGLRHTALGGLAHEGQRPATTLGAGDRGDRNPAAHPIGAGTGVAPTVCRLG